MKKSIALFSLSILALTACTTAPSPDSTIPEVEPSNVEITEVWTLGNPDATVVLTEFSDFQCPACGAYHPIIQDLVEQFENDILFEYRHFPLRSIHKNADMAAQAAEAAGIQGMFWEMHDKLFDEQRAWSSAKKPEENFLAYAEELGLDVPLFNADMNSKAVKQKVNADADAAAALRLFSTPSFLINGQLIESPGSPSEFEELIQSLIANS